MKTRTIFIWLWAGGALGLALTGCGDSGADGPRVVATTAVVADLAGQLAGDDIEVIQLIPDSVSPHDFQLSAKDRLELEDAALIVASGGGLEAGVPLDDVDAPSWSLVENADGLLGADPHVWMDPVRVAGALESLAAALGEADPGNADAYAARARELAAELERLDAELTELLAPIAREDRELVTNHDALAYFADRYDFEVIATAFPASGPEAEASAAAIAEVEAAVREHDVPAVFAETEEDPETIEQIAEATGAAIETGLHVESPGSGTYAEMLRTDAELIAAALGG